MAATDQFYRKQKTLDVVFAVSCILMLVCTVWMFWDDYNRPWKKDQRVFRDVESLANLRVALVKLPPIAEVETKRKAREEARAALKKVQDELAPTARAIKARRDQQDNKYRTIKADLDANSSYLVQAVDEVNRASTAEKPYYEQKKANLDAKVKKLSAELAQAKDDLDKIDLEYKTNIRDKLKAPEQALSSAEDDLKKTTNEFDRFAKAAAQKRWKFGDWFRTLPILDAFESPTKIQQVWLPDLTIDYNFKDVPRFDRCVTCHLGIDRAMFDKEQLRELAYAPDHLQKKLEDARRMLAERQKSGENLGFDLSDLPSTVPTLKLSRGQVSMYAAHPRLDLFLDADSPHPVEKFGCTICHSGQGSATDFNLASHTPSSFHQEEEWHKEHQWESNHFWDYPMLSNRFTEAGCLKCHHQVTDLVRYGSKNEAAKLSRGFDLVRENGCFGCHEIAGIKSGRAIGPDLRLEPNPPLDWLTALDQKNARSDPLNPPGTYRKVGPSLRRITEKTNEGWTRKWIMSPRTFREDTKMPHFYGLSTNKDEVLPADQKGFPAAEIRSIAFYLFAESKGNLAGKDTYRTALISTQKHFQEALEKEPLSDRDKKALDEATKSFVDVALLSVPWRSAEIDTVGDELKQLQDRAAILARQVSDLEIAVNKAANDEEKSRLETELAAAQRDKKRTMSDIANLTTRLHSLATPIPIKDKVLTVDGTEAKSLKTLDENKDTPPNPKNGETLFKEKGCLACHSHRGTENQGELSVHGEAIFGPNLSRIAAKLKPEAGNDARQWVYQWLLNPNIHHPRTRMPVTRLTDVEARNIADWLLSQTVTDYNEADPADPDSKTLRRLARVYLAKAPGMTRAEVDKFMPEEPAAGQEVGLPESRLEFLPRDAEEHRLKQGATTDNDLKWYIGKKSINRLACFACHDIPGFEQAKPIGTALNDWGKKDPERLAFEDAESFVKEKFNIVPDRLTRTAIEDMIRRLDRETRFKELQAKNAESPLMGEEKWEYDALSKPDPKDPDNSRVLKSPMTPDEKEEVNRLKQRLQKGPFWQPGKDGKQPYEQFFFEALEHHSREGFLHQKLVEPRSYDFNRDRAWDDRLRMPQFQFSRAKVKKLAGESDEEFTVRAEAEKERLEAEDREAVMTFILGLTAENIPLKYMPKPNDDRKKETRGRQVLEKFNCIGCHQLRSGVFEFKTSPEMIKSLENLAERAAKKYAADTFGFVGHNAWTGTAPPSADMLRAFGQVDPDTDEVFESKYAGRDSESGKLQVRTADALRFIDSKKMTRDIPVGAGMIKVDPGDLSYQSEPYGGKFVELMIRYIHASKPDLAKNPDQARNFLVPPLHREGERVQPSWVYGFLLNPKTIRPHVVLNMPRFNMSSDEAHVLVDYFGAVDRLTNPGAGTTPDVALPQRDVGFWSEHTKTYVKGIPPADLAKREDALKLFWKLTLDSDVAALQQRKTLAEAAVKNAPMDKAAKDGLKEIEDKLAAASKRVKDEDYKALKEQYQTHDAAAVDGFRAITRWKGNICLSCHSMAGVGALQAPPLDLAPDRLRPEWTKRWIANPTAMFSYNTVMPANIEKRPPGEAEEKDKYYADSIDQVTAFRNVLMDLSRIAAMPVNRFSLAAQAGGK